MNTERTMILFSAAAAVVVEGAMVQELVVEPGQADRGEVVLSNPTDHPVVVSVGLREPPAGTEGRPWVRVASAAYELAPGETLRTSYGVEVPAELASGKVFESDVYVITTPVPEWPATKDTNVSSESQVVRIVTMVGADEEP
jgi:hypothetical protein